MNDFEYCLGMVILGGGFALACFVLRWLLTKMGSHGTGKVEEVGVADLRDTFIDEPSVNVDGTPMVGSVDLNGNAYGVTSHGIENHCL